MTRMLIACAVLPLLTGVFAPGSEALRQQPPARSPLAFFEPPAWTRLARIDPLTLDPVGPQVPIGEYHAAATVSPDGSRLAVATGGPGGGIQIVDLERMETVHRVHTGIAAEALAWLIRNRLLGALQCNPANSAGRGCGIVLVDGGSGKIVRRWPETERDTQFLPQRPPLSAPKPVVATRHGVVFLLGHWSEIAAARLVLITKDEEFRSVSLSPIRVGRHLTSSIDAVPVGSDVSAGLAVDTDGERAFVVGAQPTVAEVDLRTMTVRYHEVTGLAQPRGEVSQRRAFWLPGAGIVVYGHDTVAPTRGQRVPSLPAGVRIIDPTTWRVRTIDARASRAAFAAGSLLVYGAELPGLIGYSPDGRERFKLFGDEQAREVFADGAHAYVVTRRAPEDVKRHIRLIDAATGTVLRRATPSARLVDLIPHHAAPLQKR